MGVLLHGLDYAWKEIMNQHVSAHPSDQTGSGSAGPESFGSASDNEEPPQPPRELPSDRLLRQLRDFDRTVLVAHDNPDPDAIASGWALWLLIRNRLGQPVQLVAGGQVLRAENRQVVQLLQPPLELMEQLPAPTRTAYVLVDCGPDATHHLLSGTTERTTAVVDHHVQSMAPGVPCVDIRPEAAASSSIAASYLQEQGVTPPAELATALVYAMRTETRGVETAYSELDRRMLCWLTEFANPETLAQIENAPLPRRYYSDLVLALQNTRLQDDTAFCLLPQAAAPEIVAEVADLLVRGDSVRKVFCAAVFQGDLLVSVRTSRDGGDATQLLLATLDGLGKGGGHGHRAGGKVPGLCHGTQLPREMVKELKARWLLACGVDDSRGTRLVPRRKIVQHLG